MAVLKVPGASFNLTSVWKCSRVISSDGVSYKFQDGYPSVSSTRVNFRYSLPSGAVVRKAQICASIKAPVSGASILDMNGASFQATGNQSVKVSLQSNNGEYSALFTFKANGTKDDEVSHTSILSVTNVYLEINYDVVAEYNEKDSRSADNLGGLSIPPQSVAIYNQGNGAVYLFDGVVKIQHSLTMKIEEEPDKHQEEYINNARNEPDKVQLDVIFSDVYASSGSMDASVSLNGAQSSGYNAARSRLINDGTSRSANAFGVLHALKESRQKLTLITPQFIHVDMIIAAVTANQDEETPYGWEGQVLFQHAYAAVAAAAAPAARDDNSSTATTRSDAPSQSVSSTFSDWVHGVDNSSSSTPSQSVSTGVKTGVTGAAKAIATVAKSIKQTTNVAKINSGAA